MNLTPEEVENVQKHLEERKVSCSACKSRGFTVHETTSFLPSGDKSLPLVSVICINCFNVLFFGANKLGID